MKNPSKVKVSKRRGIGLFDEVRVVLIRVPKPKKASK